MKRTFEIAAIGRLDQIELLYINTFPMNFISLKKPKRRRLCKEESGMEDVAVFAVLPSTESIPKKVPVANNFSYTAVIAKMRRRCCRRRK